MQRHIFTAIWQGLVCLLALSAIVFLLARLTGNPVDVLLSDQATAEDRLYLTQKLGLDKPLYEQYAIYMSQLVRGDLGTSTRFQRPVVELIGLMLPNSLMLGGVSIGLSLLLALPVGVYAAVRRGTLLDALARSFAVLGQAMPSFWLGILLVLVFAVWLHWFPVAGKDSLSSFVLPAATLGWYNAAGIMRLTRSAMLEVMDNEYIKLARAKGLSRAKVVWKHGFKNALIPVVTFSVIILTRALAGTIIVETVFAWPGVGRLMLDGVMTRDFPVVQAGVLIMGGMFVLGNMLVDIVYAVVDPRIRY